ncbi:MAG TPA: DeoR family transcriptional regulator [Bacillus sp. (in: firmicutes)]|nr:DeoR family transcriptional regulator [Bacillus sp. (in: firmicutes)]
MVQYLNKHEWIDIETICEMDNRSKRTARRDLIKLEEVSKVIWIWGR